MKKILLEFRGGSKGDLLVAHFNNINLSGKYSRTNVNFGELRKSEFLSKNKLPDKKTQKNLIDSILNENSAITSIHRLENVFNEENIKILLDIVNVVQLHVEKEFYKQVIIDSTIKVYCQKLKKYEKVVYKTLLLKKYGKLHKNYNLTCKIDWEILSRDIELNDTNRVIFLKNFIKEQVENNFEVLKFKDRNCNFVTYSKLFFEPYEDYYKLCTMLNYEPNIEDFIKRINNSFITNPIVFANETIDLTQFGYQYWN